MNIVKKKFKEILKDESGQGISEYILLVVVVVAIAALFKDKIKSAISAKMTDLEGKINGFSGD